MLLWYVSMFTLSHTDPGAPRCAHRHLPASVMRSRQFSSTTQILSDSTCPTWTPRTSMGEASKYDLRFGILRVFKGVLKLAPEKSYFFCLNHNKFFSWRLLLFFLLFCRLRSHNSQPQPQQNILYVPVPVNSNLAHTTIDIVIAGGIPKLLRLGRPPAQQQ